jgi:hypothetical protein
MTVDGRQPGFSEGVTFLELGNLMMTYGAFHALNLDGGGSTQMVMDYYGDGVGAQLVNGPSEAERLVGTNLAVFALPNGDYNKNGTVDAADYVIWRDSIGGTVPYDAWRNRFGLGAGAGGDSTPSAEIAPEPAAVVFLAWNILALAAGTTRIRR